MSHWEAQQMSPCKRWKATFLCGLAFMFCVVSRTYAVCMEEACWKEYNDKAIAWSRQRKASFASSLTVEPEAEPLRRAFLEWLASFKSLACEYTLESISYLPKGSLYASQVVYRYRGPLEMRDLFYAANPSHAPDKDGYTAWTVFTSPTRRVSRTDYYSSDHELVQVRASLDLEEDPDPTRGRASPDLVFNGEVHTSKGGLWLPEFFSTGYTYVVSGSTGPILVHTRAPSGNYCVRVYFNAQGLPASYAFGYDAGLTPPELKQLGRDPFTVFHLSRECYFENYVERSGVSFPLSIAYFRYKFISLDDRTVEEEASRFCDLICSGKVSSFEEYSLLHYEYRGATVSFVLGYEERIRIKPETLRINEVLADSEFEVVIPEGAEVDGVIVPRSYSRDASIAWYQHRFVYWAIIIAAAVLLLISLGAYGLYRRYLTRV